MPLPNIGDSNWGLTLNNHLSVSLDSDGNLRESALQAANVVQSTSVTTIVALTQASYDGIATKDAQTLYIITS